MASDEDHAVARQFASQRHRLIGITEVVADDQLDALPEDAAPGVEIRDRHIGGALELLAAPTLRTCHRASHANPNVRPSGRPEHTGKHDNGYDGYAAHDRTFALDLLHAWLQRHVGAVGRPDVPAPRLEARDVAFLIEADAAQHCVELAGVHDLDHRIEIE
jgi:hypothetical protein